MGSNSHFVPNTECGQEIGLPTEVLYSGFVRMRAHTPLARMGMRA